MNKWMSEWMNEWINNDFEVAYPYGGSSCTCTWFVVEFEFGNVGFWGEGKTAVPGEKLRGTRKRTNNKLNPHMASTPGFEPDHIRERRLLLLCAISPCSPPTFLSLTWALSCIQILSGFQLRSWWPRSNGESQHKNSFLISAINCHLAFKAKAQHACFLFSWKQVFFRGL